MIPFEKGQRLRWRTKGCWALLHLLFHTSKAVKLKLSSFPLIFLPLFMGKLSPRNLLWWGNQPLFLGNKITKNFLPHGVWKSQKKSHSILRAKRATFTFWVGKSSLEMQKIVNLTSFWKWDILDDFQTMWRKLFMVKCNNTFLLIIS